MSLREKINEQYNSALKSKNKNLISTLRLVLSAIKDKDISNRGGEKKEAAKEEGGTMKFAFATLVAIKNIKKGEKFNKNNIWVKRPSTGEILAEHYNDIIGRISTCDIEYDDHIKVKDIKNFKLKS